MPPAIDWSMKPKEYQQNTGGFWESSTAGAGTVSMTIGCECLDQLEELLHHLGQPPLVSSGQGISNPQVNAKVREVKSTGYPSVDTPLRELCCHLGYPLHCRLAVSEPQDGHSLAFSEPQDGCSSAPSEPKDGCSLALSKPQDRHNLGLSKLQDGHSSHNDPSEVLDLTAVFSHLSASNNQAFLEACIPPGIPPQASSTQFSPQKNSKYYAITVGKCAGVYYGVMFHS